MATPVRTDLIRALPAQSSKSLLRALFTDHPIAKLSAVGLAMVLLFLIHRELDTELFAGDVRVVTRPGSSNEIVVQCQGRYFIERVEPKSVRLQVRGIARKSNQISTPVQVTAIIPEERLVGLGEQEAWRDVTIEASDLSIPGVRGVTFTVTTSPKARVVVFEQAEVRLRAAAVQAADGQTFDVRFEPPTVTLEGPATRMTFAARAADEASVSIEVPLEAGFHENLGLPAALSAGGVILLPGQAINARVVRRETTPLEKSLSISVVIQIAEAYEGDYEYVLVEPLRSAKRFAVGLIGPPAQVNRIEKDTATLDRLAREIQLIALCEQAAWRRRSDLLEPGSKVDAEVTAMVIVPESVRREFQLRPERPLIEIGKVEIRRRDTEKPENRDGG